MSQCNYLTCDKINNVALQSAIHTLDAMPTAETDKVMGADGEETGKLSKITQEQDATIENQHVDATEGSDDDGEENSGDRHNETDAAIIENDLEIQEF